MYIIKRAIGWGSRWRHSRGFGVQSPTDYRFVRYVINEHAPYYAYDMLRKLHHDMDKEQRRFAKLLFRVANDRQPVNCICLYPPSDAIRDYLHAGCKLTVIQESDRLPRHPVAPADLVCCWIPRQADVDVDRLLQLTHERSLLVLYGIRRNKAARRLWSALLAHPSVTISYDLLYCGILFFDKKRYKHNYIINF